MLISLILPCLNEFKAIPPFMTQLNHAQDLLLKLGYSLEVILVDDGSIDGSIEAARENYPQIKVISHQKTLGYGQALKSGFSSAQGSYFAMMDIDDTYNPSDLVLLLNLISTSGADLVLGFRSESSVGFNAWRLFGNRLLRFFSRLLLYNADLDVCSGIRVMRSDFGKALVDLNQNGFSFAIAMIEHCFRLGKSVKQVTVSYSTRQGDSKLNSVREGISHLFLIFRLWLYRAIHR